MPSPPGVTGTRETSATTAYAVIAAAVVTCTPKAANAARRLNQSATSTPTAATDGERDHGRPVGWADAPPALAGGDLLARAAPGRCDQPTQHPARPQPSPAGRQAQQPESEQTPTQQGDGQPTGGRPRSGRNPPGEVALTADRHARQPHRGRGDRRDHRYQQLAGGRRLLLDPALPVAPRAVDAGEGRTAGGDVPDGRRSQRDLAEPAPPDRPGRKGHRAPLLDKGAQDRQRLGAERNNQPSGGVQRRQVGRLQGEQLRHDEGEQKPRQPPPPHPRQNDTSPADEPLAQGADLAAVVHG